MEILVVPPDAEELPLVLELGMAGIAMLSTTYVIFTYFFFSGQRNERRLYLSYVAASKLLTASLTMAVRAVRPEGWACAAFGTAYIVADVVSVLWMAVVFAHAHEEQTDQPPTPRWRYHTYVWTLSAAVVGGMVLLFGAGISVADLFRRNAKHSSTYAASQPRTQSPAPSS